MILCRAAVVSLLLLTSLAAPLLAAPPGFAFLEVPAGARASALGGASAASTAGVEAAFWNPAGLADVEKTQFVASHFEYIAGLRHDQFALAGQLFGGGLAGSVRAEYSQPIDERDDVGNLIGSFGAHDLEFQLAYGWKAGTTRFGFGAQAIRERIASEAATTWGGSAGGTWTPQRWPNARLGVVAQHVGPAAHYTIDGQTGAPVSLPASLQTGLGWHHALSHGFAFDPELDVRMTRGRQGVIAWGGELNSTTGAALRVGVRQGDDLANFSAGLGYRFGLFHVDYAWVPSKLDLSDTHRFSFGAQF